MFEHDGVVFSRSICWERNTHLMQDLVELYDAALEVAPTFADAHFECGAVLLNKADQPARALPYFEVRATILCLSAVVHRSEYHDKGYSKSIDVTVCFLNMLYLLHNLQFALAQGALRAKPEFAEAAVNAGLALKAMGRTNEAIEMLQKGVELLPTMAAAHANLGVALQAVGRLEEAVAS